MDSDFGIFFALKKTTMKRFLLSVISLCTAAISGHATAINLSGANGESTLQTIAAGSTINIAADQITSDSYWTARSISGQMVVEIAGYAGSNAFGIFKQGSPGTRLQLFAGSAGAGANSGLLAIPTGWSSFGFYLENTSASFIWYSDASLNPFGYDHFVTFKGTEGQTLTSSGVTFGNNDYLIGIEDLNLGDYDYNDMVVKLHMNPVPDAGSSALMLGGACALLCGLRRRRAA